jgi:tetratricopeptide (TPR) repeat protein
MLSTELAAGDRLRSIPGETVARAKLDLALAEADSFGAETLDRLRSRLGTDLVVVGSYLALGERGQSRIRLDLRLQDAAAGETLALISQSGREQELFELISRTGAALRERLGIAPRSEQEAQWVRTSLPSDPETARLYIEGLERWRVFDADAARRLLEQAVSRDPEFPLAHLVLAGALRHLGHFEKARQEAWRAMELSGSLPWQERLGVEAGYRLLAGEWQRATEIYRTLYEAEPDNVEYGMLLAEAQKHIGEAKEARETLAALRRLPAPASQDLRIDAWEARAFLMLDDFDSALAVARNLASRAQAVGARALFADAKYIEMLVLQGRAEHEKAIAAATEAQGLFAAVGDLDGVARQLQTVSELLLARGDAPGAWQKAQENLDVRRQIGDPGRVAEALAWIGVLQREQGHLAEAGRTFAEAVQMVQKAEDPSIERSVQEEWGFLMWSRGDLAGARQRLARIEELERGLETDWKGPNPRLLAIVLALEEERPAEAEALARKALAQDKAKRMCKLGALLRALLARALLAQGRTAEALGVVEEAEPLAEQGRILFARVCVATAAGRVRAATGRAAEVAEALRGLESAAAEAAQAGLVGLELEARLELGRAELAAGKAAEGSARLAAVAEAARDKGFGLVARKAEGERRERP